MKKLLFAMLLGCTSPVSAQHAEDLFALSFDELLGMQVVAPGKFRQDQDAAPGVITVITREEIQALGAGSLLEVLERAPSVLMTGSFFYPQNLAVFRGIQLSHSNNDVLLLINGRPFRDSFTGGQNFAFFTAFPVESLERIEVVRGPGSVLYGSNAFSGVINLVTVAEPVRQIRMEGGNFGRGLIEASTAFEAEDVRLNLAARFYTEQGWKHSAFDNRGIFGSFDAGEQQQSLLLNGDIKGIKVSAFNLISEQDFWGTVSSWAGPEQSQRQVRSRRSGLDLGYQWQLQNQTALTANISYSASRFSQYNYEAVSDNYLGELMLDHQLESGARWLSGVTGWHQQVDSRPRLSLAPIPAVSRNWWTFYSQYQSDADKDFSWHLGAQVNKVPQVDANLDARIGALYRPWPGHGIKLSYGSAFRAAYAVETSFDLIICCDEQGNNRGGLRGNPALSPEQIHTLDIQYFIRNQSYRHALTLFHSKLSELIGRQRAPDRVLDFVNEGRLEVYGLELEGKKVLTNGQLNYSYSYQKNSSMGVDNFTLMPTHMLKWGLMLQPGQNWSLGIQHQWYSAFHPNSLRNPQVQELNPESEAFHYLSLKLAKTVRWGAWQAETYVYLTNLLDQQWHQPEFAGRSINTHPARSGAGGVLGVKFSF